MLIPDRALLFPVLLIVTIRFGIFTPSEVGAFAVFYVSAIGFLIHRELTFSKFKDALNAAVVDTGVIMFIIAMAAIAGYVLASERHPQTVALLADNTAAPAVVVYVSIILLLLMAGTVIEGSVIILLLTAVLLPIVQKIGMDAV